MKKICDDWVKGRVAVLIFLNLNWSGSNKSKLHFYNACLSWISSEENLFPKNFTKKIKNLQIAYTCCFFFKNAYYNCYEPGPLPFGGTKPNPEAPTRTPLVSGPTGLCGNCTGPSYQTIENSVSSTKSHYCIRVLTITIGIMEICQK